MLTSLALLFLAGLVMAMLSQSLGLPRIIGMLLAGILFGPFLFNVFDASLLDNSAALRRMALIIILIRAGLSLNLGDLRQVGRPALLMSFLPASFELLGYLLFAPLLLGISWLDAALMGAVLAAVSPAVVVPRMVYLIEHKYGTSKSIPQLILTGASCDDIVVIVLFTTFLSMAQGAAVDWSAFMAIPLSIVLGVLAGAGVGFFLLQLFKRLGRHLSDTQQVLVILSAGFLLVGVERWLEGKVALSGLLAVMAMASFLKMKGSQAKTSQYAANFNQIWVAAELLLFVLVGATVDISALKQAGLAAVLLILASLIFRSLGVYLSLLGTALTGKEKLFTIFAYLPKATVQAAIGAVPLSVGLQSGQLILAVAVLGIVITAPLGAILIDKTYPHFLSKERQ